MSEQEFNQNEERGNSGENYRRIVIFDTTLRDGEQSPGASMNLREKLEAAQGLEDLGVDVIEAGFPIISPGDFQSVKEISKILKRTSACGLARCVDKDIDAAGEALKDALHPRIHIFLATSVIHRKYKLRMSQDEIIAKAVEGVRRGRNLCSDIEFSPEDATRTEIDFLCRVVEAVIDAGARTVNIPDTVGYTTPQEMYDRIKALINRVPNIDKAILSVHCHNDLGMAVANSLSAVSAGAGQIECTINGLGERAGNCALEEVVMAMRTRPNIYKADTKIISQKLVPMSRLISRITGLQVPRNKAIVGMNAFAHEAGIHQDGILKERTTYEIMSPESVGFTKTDLVLGKHSGRAALADRAHQLGYVLSPEQLDAVFVEFKKLTDRKKEVYDADIHALIDQQNRGPKDEIKDNKWKFVSYSLTCSSEGSPKLTLALTHRGEVVGVESEEGDGPIHAAFWAIRKASDLPLIMKEFKIEAITGGPDAQGVVIVHLQDERNPEKVFRGQGVSTDIIEAGMIAMVNALNRMS
ncbi:MAG: 2-isopropylmalate synthase [Planctomycetia bacterium]|nr:2-isopropylmalate synthase [Planctomycetia bacterium]